MPPHQPVPMIPTLIFLINPPAKPGLHPVTENGGDLAHPIFPLVIVREKKHRCSSLPDRWILDRVANSHVHTASNNGFFRIDEKCPNQGARQQHTCRDNEWNDPETFLNQEAENYWRYGCGQGSRHIHHA